ncbi:MAG: hypothetical protein J6562_06115, partial [Candidatus Schmidhempelia sp.]|nr:hypothetical protein [Candidatus Schmidhempelia sp.]
MIRLHPLITIICLTTITSAHAASHYQDTSKNTKDIIIKDKPNAIGIEADSHVTNSAKITIKNNRVRSDETIAIKSKQKITTTEGSQINIDTKSKNAIGILLENEKNHGPLIIDAHGEITVSNTQRGATNYGILSKTDSKDSNKISKIIYDDVNSDINIDANDSSGTGIMGSISNGGNLIIDVENIKQIRVNAQEAIGISAVADGDKVGNIDIELGKGAVDITSSSGSNGFGIKSINSSGGNNNIKNNFDIHSNYIGIYAENNKGGNIDVRSSGKIQVMTNGNIGILTKSSGPNKSNIIIAQSGEIVANGRGIYAENTTGGDITINNLKDGKILSLKDEAIKAEAKAGQITTNNDGIIQGYVTYSGKNVKFINQKHGILELLNNYDNGVTNDFGTNGKFENNGSIKFSWNPSNNTAIFKNVAKFYHNNTATIDIRGAETGNPITLANIGNTIEITNQGQGQFISNGGTLLVNTYIAPNGGKSDKLIIDNASTGSGGSTLVHVIPSTDSEFGKLTGDGIEIIQVKGHSSQDAFRLAAPVVNGEYEYGLVKGGSQSANSWFLRNTYGFNPAMGGYLANMRVATTLFSHTLHNRAIAGKANLLSDTSILQNLWLTTRIAHSHHHSVNNSFNNRDNTYMTQLGR